MKGLNAKAQESLDKVIATFESGDISPIVEMARIRLPEDAPASKWTFSNQVLAFAQTGSLDNRGYKQWQKVKRQVQKGQHAAYILAPRIIKEDDGETTKCIGFLGVAVFGYHQTDGDDDAFKYEPIEMPPLMDVAEKLGIAVKFAPTLLCLGSCSVDGSDIIIGSEDVATFFHELSHAAHARVNGGRLEAGQHEGQETVADFAACVLMELYGLGDRTGNTWKYISQYSANPLQAIQKALADVEKVLDVILEAD